MPAWGCPGFTRCQTLHTCPSQGPGVDGAGYIMPEREKLRRNEQPASYSLGFCQLLLEKQAVNIKLGEVTAPYIKRAEV